jgi:hypothetical protein
MELELVWRATSGRFSNTSSRITKYRCGSVGDQLLTLSATDPEGCERELNLDVTCLDE